MPNMMDGAVLDSAKAARARSRRREEVLAPLSVYNPAEPSAHPLAGDQSH
jgi:hypothetical protein